jgi:hypothetical protein
MGNFSFISLVLETDHILAINHEPYLMHETDSEAKGIKRHRSEPSNNILIRLTFFVAIIMNVHSIVTDTFP